MKLLYLFSGTRKGKFTGTPGVDYPDTQLYGLNHMAACGIDAETKEWTDVIRSPFLQRLIGFRLRHLVMFFTTRTYDVVFGSSLLYMMMLKKIFRPKTTYVLFNLGINRTVAAHRNHPIRLWFINSLLDEFAGIVCLSHVQKEYLETHCPKLQGRVSVVRLGVDTAFYTPTYDNRSALLLSVGRDNGRDYQTLIDAARLMPHRQFGIVCSQRNIASIGTIPPNVTVTFDLPLAELQKKYQSAQLMLLTTHDDTWLDGSDCSGQTVLLDAMANGLPVVASRKAYIADYADDGRDIKLVDCYAPEQIVSAIQALEDSSVRSAVAVHARARVEMSSSTVQMAKSLADIFKRIAV